mgnify:CR=1 FL=1
MKLMTGNSNKPLAAAIADYIEIPLTDASVRRFADEEVFVETMKEPEVESQYSKGNSRNSKVERDFNDDTGMKPCAWHES